MTGVTYHWDFSFLWMYRWLLLKGLGFTILYTVGSIVFGLIIGLLVGLMRLSKSWLVNFPLIAYIEAFRCTPLLVQIIWFYYAFPVLVGIDIPAHAAGMLVLSLYTGAFYAEIFRGGVISIERGQWDAARAIGMRHIQVLRRGDPAAGRQAHDSALHQPVDHPAQEHVAGVDDCRRRPTVPGHSSSPRLPIGRSRPIRRSRSSTLRSSFL